MIPSVPSVSAGLNDFGRALTGGLRSLADLQHGPDAPLRGVAEIGAAADSGAGRGADQSAQRAAESDPVPDPARAAADIITSRAQVRAAIALVRANDETIGTLLDMFG